MRRSNITNQRIRLSMASLFCAVLLCLLLSSVTPAQTTGFTYQGALSDGGTMANGNYDLQFSLWDSLSGGSQIGSTQSLNTVAVANGIFSVTLDFGANAFSGAVRFLEISTRPAGGGAFTLLTPRQQVTSTPYAIRSLSTTSADTATNAIQLGGVAANQYVQTNDARLSDPRPPTPGSSSYIQNTNNQQAANFNINGNGTAAGTLSGNVVDAATQYNLGGKLVLYADNSQNTFVGKNTGTGGTSSSLFGFEAGAANGGNSHRNSFFGYHSGFATHDGSQDTFVGPSAGSANTTGTNNSFFGESAGSSNVAGSKNTMIGAFADTSTGSLSNVTAIGYAAEVSQSNSLVLGSINGVNFGTADTNVGIGTTAPAYRLTVKTPTSSYGIVQTDGTIIVGTYVGGSGNGGYIGTKSNHPLHFFVNDGAPSVTVEVGGTLRVNTLGAAGSTSLCRNASNQISTCSSSLRYKKDLQPFTRGLALLNNLKPITFKWKADGSPDVGFGAEDVAAVEPLLVTHNEQGQVEGVKYDRITAVLVNAVKEQQAQIAQQQRELNELRRLVNARHRRFRRRTHQR